MCGFKSSYESNSELKPTRFLTISSNFVCLIRIVKETKPIRSPLFSSHSWCCNVLGRKMEVYIVSFLWESPSIFRERQVKELHPKSIAHEAVYSSCFILLFFVLTRKEMEDIYANVSSKSRMMSMILLEDIPLGRLDLLYYWTKR